MAPRFILYLVTFATILVKSYFALELLKTKSENNSILDLDLLKFNSYMTQFNKKYSVGEYRKRLENFKASLAEIANLNAIEDNALFGLTEFSDMSEQEFSERMLMEHVQRTCYGYNRTVCPPQRDFFKRTSRKNAESVTSLLSLPEKIDWREKGVIGPVQNQKGCRACWAISVVGVMETMARINNLSNKSLSIQEVLDCLTDDFMPGCAGGNVAATLLNLCNYRKSIVPAEKYPLTLKTEKCQNRRKTPGIKLKKFAYLCNKTEETIQRAILNGPVTAVVNAAIWRHYLGGIIRRTCVGNQNSNAHVIQIVGYDRTGDIPYYILKNSWGELFGDHGYVKIEMDKNVCGIAEEVGVLDVE